MSFAPDSDNPVGNRSARLQIVRRILAILSIALVLLGGAFLARISIQGWTMYQSGTRMLEAVRSPQSDAQLSVLSDEFQQIATAVEAIDQQSMAVFPLLNGLDGFTVVGNTAAALPELLSAGSAMANVSSDAFTMLVPGLTESDENLSLALLVDAVSASGVALSQLAPDAEAASLLLNSIDAANLHPAITEEIGDVQMIGRLLPTGLKLAPHISSLLGFDGASTYLVLIHNNHELRATGGFISAVGRLTIEDGQIAEMDFVDSYEIYRDDGEYPPAPQPMQQYMNIPVMLFRDTNWSPDFPTSAELARSFYLQETGIDVDGVISIDMNAVEKLVQALGPLQIAGSDQAVTGSNIVDFIKEVWARPLESEEEVDPKANSAWWSQRKDFIPALADAAVQRVESGNVSYPALAEAALASLDERSVQVWLAGEELSSKIAEFGWDGGLRPDDDADFLALVDTNMGYNKVNSVIQPTVRYDVNWPNANQPGVATAIIDYLHPVESPDHVCDQRARYGDGYDDMVERCYYDYVRLYAPAGSKLLDTEGFELDSVTSRRGENGTQVFAGWFILPPGETHTVSFTYELPETITQDDYRLVVQRQSGTAGLPLQVYAGGETIETLVESARLEWTPGQ